ncbi:molecular chaperone [Salmonella enterica]|nr:molecular chaperone [Salmonella enterica]
MFIGFDYGTANCSVAIMRDGHPQLLTMENNSALLPSMLCAPTREAVSEWLYRHHDVPATDEETQALLRRAIRYNREEDIEVGAQSVQFGLASLAHYIDDPQEVWFVKSPKSFLGASGLKPQQVALFEDLVCAMMVHIRHTAHSQLPEAITQAVIGRPINFQGLGGDDANRQAQGILERAAKRAGFQEVVFQYEPVAAGLDYEATLREEKRVLVVDIGGGTTDCSMLLMGPQWRQRLSYRLVRCAEESKIALSGQADVTARLPFISDDLAVAISQQGLEAALDQPLTRILEQVQLALDSAQEKPDVIYLTGGSARSPLIKKALSEQLPGIPVAGGDDFGSVTAGLARWAEVVFR